MWELLPVGVLLFLSSLVERGLLVDILLPLSPLPSKEFLVGVSLLFSLFEDRLLGEIPLTHLVLLGERLPLDDPLLLYGSFGEGLMVFLVLFLLSCS